VEKGKRRVNRQQPCDGALRLFLFPLGGIIPSTPLLSSVLAWRPSLFRTFSRTMALSR
jgi:hypothetical protein